MSNLPVGAGPAYNYRTAPRPYLQDWIVRERAHHADVKYEEGNDNRERLRAAMETEGFAKGGDWELFIFNYLSRAQVLGLDTEQGRQQMGKAITTLLHCLETAIEVHGPMPAPGQTSGNCEPWLP